jgi:hypothetical protein
VLERLTSAAATRIEIFPFGISGAHPLVYRQGAYRQISHLQIHLKEEGEGVYE